MIDNNKIATILEEMNIPEPYEGIITESLHPDIKADLESDSPIEHKFTRLTKTIRGIAQKNEDSGLETNKPAKGSSRAVFFPKEPKKITIEGKEASVPSVVKVAFKSPLDPYTGHHSLLGEEQNRIESDRWTNNTYGVLRHNEGNDYSHNPDGVLPPHFGHHEDHHWLEMGRITKLNSADVKEATKTKEFPKGITMKQFTETVQAHHDLANGRTPYKHDQEKFDKLSEHPLIDSIVSLMSNTGLHPNEFSPRNMGIWKHPHTGQKHVVLADYGANDKILKLYGKARQEKYNRNRYRGRGY